MLEKSTKHRLILDIYNLKVLCIFFKTKVTSYQKYLKPKEKFREPTFFPNKIKNTKKSA